jgi:hypothetical protein
VERWNGLPPGEREHNLRKSFAFRQVTVRPELVEG